VQTVVSFRGAAGVLLGVVLAAGAPAQEKQQDTKEASAGTTAMVSFKEQVVPLVRKYCLPCHARVEENPSELSLDDYASLREGGRHGSPVVPGKPGESLLMKKLHENPPFGQRMPLNSRKKVKEGRAKWLTDEEVQTIATWVDQGAKDN
jgi:uncharacterized membrane protein